MVMAKRNSNTLYVMDSLSQIVLATLCMHYDDFKNNRPIILLVFCLLVCVLYYYDVLRTVFFSSSSGRVAPGEASSRVGSTMRRGQHCD